MWEYQHHIKSYKQLSMLYGLQFWKTLAKLNMCHEVMDNEKVSSDCFAAYRVFCGKLASLELASVEVYTKAKFDINAVKWLAEISETDKQAFRLLPLSIEPHDIEHYRYMLHTAAMLEFS